MVVHRPGYVAEANFSGASCACCLVLSSSSPATRPRPTRHPLATRAQPARDSLATNPKFGACGGLVVH
eukprot:6711331-Pyramimonas_sp.AAC.1